MGRDEENRTNGVKEVAEFPDDREEQRYVVKRWGCWESSDNVSSIQKVAVAEGVDPGASENRQKENQGRSKKDPQ